MLIIVIESFALVFLWIKYARLRNMIRQWAGGMQQQQSEMRFDDALARLFRETKP